MPARAILSAQALRTPDQPITYFIQQAVENPKLISLAAGLVDAGSLPVAEIAAALDVILGCPTTAQTALQYGTTQGYAPLRDKLLARAAALDGLTPQELSLSPDDVIVTTGSQQLLQLVNGLLLDPGDLVITEAPSYFVFEGALESAGARTLSVPMDEDGMRTDLLEELLACLERTGEIERLRFIYVCDYFQNPSGRTLSLPRRRHLFELARRYSRDHRIFIIEDAAYRELCYEGVDLPSIKSFDTGNEFVILAMTFSKPCAPGLKTGYGLLPRDLVAPLIRLKGVHDFGSNNLTQHLLDRLLDTGAYDRHVARLRDVYRAKRDAVLAALRHEFHGSPNGQQPHHSQLTPDSSLLHWTHPDGGLYVWLSFPPTLDTGPAGPLMPAALREGVLYVPGEFCYVKGGVMPTNEARLCFGVVAVDQIGEAVRRLARAAATAGVRDGAEVTPS